MFFHDNTRQNIKNKREERSKLIVWGRTGRHKRIGAGAATNVSKTPQPNDNKSTLTQSLCPSLEGAKMLAQKKVRLSFPARFQKCDNYGPVPRDIQKMLSTVLAVFSDRISPLRDDITCTLTSSRRANTKMLVNRYFDKIV
mmetsp:Transcript_40211/g.78593  ORF Transcript_40211/g.78593 Transcript_40211/m.78593 type:complete len:141 (+) Transcript_40211:200-622(+)